MGSSNPPIRLVAAEAGADIDLARVLFRSYASEFADSITERLCLQGFEGELDGLPGRYAPPSGCLLLAMVGDRAAGCVAMRDLGGGTCEMKRLYITPNDRGRGLGRVLVEGILARAEAAGYHRMVLDTVPAMASAVALYRALGFEETGPYWDCPVEGTIYMGKSLGGRREAAEEISSLAQDHVGPRRERPGPSSRREAFPERDE